MLEQLLRRHPMHKKYADYWQLLDKMVKGGSSVGIEEKKQLLVSPNCRSQDVINERASLAPYYSLMGVILTRLQSQLLSVRGSYLLGDENDDFWQSEFFTRGVCDEKGRQSFQHGLKQSVITALAQGSAIAVVDTANVHSSNKVQQSSQKGDEPYVIIRQRSDLWDWDSDTRGLSYAKLHTYRVRRSDWKSDPVPEHEFLIYERNEKGVFASRYVLKPKDPGLYRDIDFGITDITEANTIITAEVNSQEIFYIENNGTKKSVIPIAILEFGSALWLADQLFDSQKSLFNQTVGIEWALLSTNYAQLVFSDVEDEDLLKSRIGKTGDGYYWALPSDVKTSWLERNGHGIELAMRYRDEKKAEMLEIISQIALNAASSYSNLSRSGESKKEDRRNLDILLEIYGQSIAEFAKSILDIAAIARGSSKTWTVDGFCNYDSDTLLEDLLQYDSVNKVINSPTFRDASLKQIVSRAIDELNLNPDIKIKVIDEITANNFALDDRKLEFLRDLSATGRLSSEGLLQIVKQIGILPDNFSIQDELKRIGYSGNTSVD